MHSDGEVRRPVVVEHPLPHRGVREIGRRDGRLERQRELFLLSSGAWHALRAGHEAELPQQLATLESERVTCPRLDERCQLRLSQRNTLCEIANRHEVAVAVALG